MADKLSKSLASFRREQAEATARNINSSRPAGAAPSSTAPARTSTPRTAVASGTATPKRNHDDAFAGNQSHGHELLTQFQYALDKLKKNNLEPISFDDLISYLSLPNDAQRRVPLIRRALLDSPQVEFVPKARSGNGKDSFRYRPKHPVTNAEQLKDYLARQTTAQGILVKDLKDGWPDCIKAIDELEKEHYLLATRNKKDNTPKMVWPDSPSYHTAISSDFHQFWMKTKLPATENEIRAELEKVGITPTSQVKEMKKDMKKKDRKKGSRRGGKTTNLHMQGILKDYSNTKR